MNSIQETHITTGVPDHSLLESNFTLCVCFDYSPLKSGMRLSSTVPGKFEFAADFHLVLSWWCCFVARKNFKSPSADVFQISVISKSTQRSSN